MSEANKILIRKLNKGFEDDDVEVILSCVADDVHWFVPGAYDVRGKAAFEREIHNEKFVGVPIINVKHEVAEGDWVSVAGSVRGRFNNGDPLYLLFHNSRIEQSHSGNQRNAAQY